MPTSWAATTPRLAALADRHLFFVGGAPRSGTTWLQQILDAHPEIACRGEGLFLHHLAVPLERVMSERAGVIAGKNRDLFAHTGGFAPFAEADVEHLVGTAILLAMQRYAGDFRAVGEKTPENVFFFPRLLTMFPHARFIGIARDPRDVLSSAWHFFGRATGQAIEDFVRAAIPSMDAGARAMQAFRDAFPQQTRLVTYEALLNDPVPVLADLCGLLGVSSEAAVLKGMLARTAFVADGGFRRRGAVGDWRQTLPAALADDVVAALGWMFPAYGWVR